VKAEEETVEADQKPNDKSASLLNCFKTMVLKPSKELKGVDLLEHSHWLVLPNNEVFKQLLQTTS